MKRWRSPNWDDVVGKLMVAVGIDKIPPPPLQQDAATTQTHRFKQRDRGYEQRSARRRTVHVELRQKI